METVDYGILTDRINFICYKLEHNTFLSAQDREILLAELKELVEKRKKLAETLIKNEE